MVTPADQFAEACREALPAHRYCDDTWYSCPQEPNEGCADESRGDKCNCGYERLMVHLRTLARAFADRECEVEFGPLHSALVAHSEHVAAFFKRCGLTEER